MPLYAWGQGLKRGKLPAFWALVGGWGGGRGERTRWREGVTGLVGCGVAGRVGSGGGWQVEAGSETWRKVVIVWRKVVMTWRKVVNSGEKNSMVIFLLRD